MIIEAHDHEIENTVQGTLTAAVGRKGTIEYAYQGEMYVQAMLQDFPTARRLYAHEAGVVLAVWARDEQGSISYVGRWPGYSGTWELPYLYENAHDIAVAVLGKDVQDLDEAAQWAATRLQDTVATIVLLDKDGILAAWEKGPAGPILVSKGRRPLPTAT